MSAYAQVVPGSVHTEKVAFAVVPSMCFTARGVLMDAEQLSFPQTWPQPVSDRLTLVVDVNVVLVRNGFVLLGRRRNTGYEDGSLHLPAGHLEGGESLVTALLREAWEELGIEIDPSHPRLVHVIHHSAGGGRLSFFFEVTDWSGQVSNREPHKCKGIDWYSLSALPDRIIPYTQQALLAYLSGVSVSGSGWTDAVSSSSRRRRSAAG